MNLKHIIRTFSTVLILSMLMLLCSCGDDSSSQSVSMQSDTDITTMDPQLSSTPAELTAVANCFEGLMRLDANGNVINGFAKAYSVSNDGLIYTFTLKGNAVWSDGETLVTADDFVYGITRALMPETKAPFASLLFSIKNAEDVNNGKKLASQLGITAVNSSTVRIMLGKTDHNLLYALANPVAAPCNKAFFDSTKGKYGLDRKNSLTNGCFYIKGWSQDTSLLRLFRFSDYSGDKPTLSSFSIGYAKESQAISENVVGGYIGVGTMAAENLETAKKFGIKGFSFFNSTYCLKINQEFAEKNSKLAESLFKDIDKSIININLPVYLKPADGIVPLTAVERNKKYRDAAQALALPDFDSAASIKILDELEDSRKTLSKLTLYYPENNDFKLIASILSQTWQKDLTAYINIEPIKEDELISKVSSNDYTLAIVPVKSNDNTAYGTMINFTDHKLSGYQSLLDNSATSADEDAIQSLKKSEQMLVDKKMVYPLVYSSECYATTSDIDGLIFSRSGSFIDFSKATVAEN